MEKQTNQYTNSLFSDDPNSPFPSPVRLEKNNLAELFFEKAREKNKFSFCQRCDPKDERWYLTSWNNAKNDVLALCHFLKASASLKGYFDNDSANINTVIQPKIAVFSSTRYEWLIADFATLSLNCVSAPIYHSVTAQEAGFIFWNSEARIVFIENNEQAQKIVELIKSEILVPAHESFPGGLSKLNLDLVISFEECDTENIEQLNKAGIEYQQFSEIIKNFSNLSNEQKNNFETTLLNEIEKIPSSSIASIVYTSGTTGIAKGVVQTHRNHLSMLDSVIMSGLVDDAQGVFLFLPLAHSFARLIGYCIVAAGGYLVFPTITDTKKSVFVPRQIFKDIASSHPKYVPTVPRMFEKLQSSLQSKKKSGIQKIVTDLFSWARQYQKSSKKNFIKDFLSRKIFAFFKRKIFGTRFVYAISGGAPISVEVIEFFESFGVKILQGYGLTETTPAMSSNTARYNKIGTVGRLFDCNQVRIADDKEILVKGDNVAQGYYRMPQATQAAWIQGNNPNSGWFQTGDLGELDSEGYLKIVGRKKELIVTSGGKKIPPSLIEGKLKAIPGVAQAVVIGDKRSYLVALLTLDHEALKDFSEEERNNHQSTISEFVDKINADFANFERVKKFKILEDDFTIENGLLSPSLKVRRNEVLKRYDTIIEELYQ